MTATRAAPKAPAPASRATDLVNGRAASAMPRQTAHPRGAAISQVDPATSVVCGRPPDRRVAQPRIRKGIAPRATRARAVRFPGRMSSKTPPAIAQTGHPQTRAVTGGAAVPAPASAMSPTIDAKQAAAASVSRDTPRPAASRRSTVTNMPRSSGTSWARTTPWRDKGHSRDIPGTPRVTAGRRGSRPRDGQPVRVFLAGRDPADDST